ncbi:MAG: lipoyl(octanoyl) transferase LipB [Kiritimatiellae bacterium]|nr:lipoyl(octanoyl) transferase LipB [Kiritimatiellia bacterium]
MRELAVSDLGQNAGYNEVLALQERLHHQRVAGAIRDTLLLLEHRPVYTLGRSAAHDHVLYSGTALRQAGIEQVTTTRGGDVTYHGPGQLVGYPVIHLGDAGLKVLEYISGLEETLIRVAATFGIQAGRDPRNRGVWVGNDKLAALGIRVSHQVTMHGFALNVNTRLSDYQGIVACGLRDAGVTSLSRLLGNEIDIRLVKTRVEEAFRAVFGYGPDTGKGGLPTAPDAG